MALLLLSILVFSSLLQTLALSSPNNLIESNHQLKTPHIKSLQLTVYVQETLNRTAFFIVKGVPTPKQLTKISNPFGSLFAFNDRVAETPDPNSKLLGYVEGSAVISSFVGDRVTTIVRISLEVKGYKGDILCVGSTYFTKYSELPVVGGTEDFRFVQGYMKQIVMDTKGPTTNYRVEFQLYWPFDYDAFGH